MGRDKRLRLQRLLKAEEIIYARIPLNAIEASIVRKYARDSFPLSSFGKPQVGQAVADLLRMALNCLRDHIDRYQSKDPVTFGEAKEAGLRLPGRAQLRHGKGSRKPGEARKLLNDP